MGRGRPVWGLTAAGHLWKLSRDDYTVLVHSTLYCVAIRVYCTALARILYKQCDSKHARSTVYHEHNAIKK